MRMFERPSTWLALFLVILTPTVSSAQAASDPLKLTKAEISAINSSHYHIERVGIKYQPYIITHDDQELVQPVYDTREEAQARVDEIKKRTGAIGAGLKGGRTRKSASVRSNRTSTK